MIDPDKMYSRDKIDVENNKAFAALLAKYEYRDVQPFQPSPQKAPWHWQAILDGAEGFPPYELNFWPHVAKANLHRNKSIEGWKNIEEWLGDIVQQWQEDHARDR
jgi:hypothetical protein